MMTDTRNVHPLGAMTSYDNIKSLVNTDEPLNQGDLIRAQKNQEAHFSVIMITVNIE